MKITEKTVNQLDPQGVYQSVLALPDQIEHVFEEVKPLKFPDAYLKVNNIVVAGMGGSALGARLIDSLQYDILKVPLEIVNDYHLPAYVTHQTLVIASSYSGTTEEVLSCYQEAKRSKAKLLAISTGGELAKRALSDQIPSFIFNPVFNPSQQPRMAIGYAITSLLGVMTKLKLIKLSAEQIGRVVKGLKQQNERLKLQQPDNPAIKLAAQLGGRIPILVASEHLYGATHTTKNQLNENAKTFSVHFPIPELNHHLMEGLKFPKANREVLFFIFYESDLYHDRVKRRHQLTKQLIEKHKIPSYGYRASAPSRLEQAFEIIQFGNFYSFYLAILNGIDPTPIPTVDWFKQQLRK